ncbi:MAG TPA: hypothetical protein VFH78_12895, partial [Candidatus Thermoplasmatota archaeon]|nr:hypothetical protein [Candidatus Thermoplasmatota archaeon]
MRDSAQRTRRPPSSERSVDVYLPSIERRDQWHAAAAKRGQKLSAMIYQIVEMHLAEEADPALRTPAAAPGEVDALRGELSRAR